MTITLALSERVARRIAALADREVAAIGQKLVRNGAAGVAGVMAELREVMELVTQLESAGVRVRGDSVPAAAAPQLAHSPAPAAVAPEPDVPLADADDAPPPAVLAARKASNGSRARFVADREAYSGP